MRYIFSDSFIDTLFEIEYFAIYIFIDIEFAKLEFFFEKQFQFILLTIFRKKLEILFNFSIFFQILSKNSLYFFFSSLLVF